MSAIVETLINWDGSLNKDDALYHLQRHMSKMTGYTHLSVTIENAVLRVAHAQGQLLVIDLPSGREVVGRCRHFGISGKMMNELRSLAQ